jgi:hypothetical protein
VDEEARQFILMIEKRQAERDRELRQWLDERQAERDRNFRRWLDEFVADSIRRHNEVMVDLKAQHEALFSIIDRLDRGGGAPA